MSMCCGGPRVPLSQKRQVMMQLLRFGVLCEFILSIVALCGGRYFDGAIFIIMSLCFIYPLRDKTQAGTDLICLLIIHSIQAVFSIIYAILHGVGVQVYPRQSLLWRRNCLDASVYGLCAVFVLVSVLCYLIFREVRRKLWGGDNSDDVGDDVNNLNRSGPQHTNQNSYPGNRNNDVESGRSPQSGKKPDGNWKKSGGRKLG
jgi:hypothetical protein